MKRILFTLALAVSTLFATSLATAQSSSQAPAQTSAADQSSLGDYARKIKKDPAEKAKPKVFDNDNLPTDDKLSIVGPKTADSGNTVATADKKDATATAAKPDDDQAKKQAAWKEWQQKVASQKDQIDLAARELDVLQREYQLRAAEMYADAGNRLRNQTQWDKQDADYKQKIADKQKSVDDAKQKLTDLQEEAHKAGVPSSMTE